MNALMKGAASSLPDASIMGVVALVAFFIAYSLVLLAAARRRPEHDRVARMPLED